ncbi:MAG: hypothetical protein KatS3mg095_0361 [Candidatus Parcubacteria bacterium]|nr:MAG: hypothetical protein KatS3mg095_0361 [Candidatus Parcubacteria bacterium]
MLDFCKNKINFNLLPIGKSKNCVLIFYDEDIFKTDSFNFLNKETKIFIKKTYNFLSKIEFYYGIHPQQSFCAIKAPFQKIKSIKEFSVFIRKVFKFIKDNKINKIDVYLNDISDFEKYFEIIVVNLILSNFDFSLFYKNKKENNLNFEINFYVAKKYLSSLKKILKDSIIIGEEINKARFLSNLPGGDLTPSIMVDIIKEINKDINLKIKILSDKELKKIGAGGILGVSKGSKEKPFLVILENHFKGQEIHFVGKGITFDTGGLHLKPSEHINEMHMDMSGAASVLLASSLIKKLNLNINFRTLIPLAENMISGESYRPGDILKTISGKTIEVGSPDAEGRIILADAIDYGKKFYKPDLIITLATLTGASMIALGNKASALFSNNKKLQNLFMLISEKTWDTLWPLPLWEEYRKDIEAPFADVWNIGKFRWGGAIHGAIFLWEFAKPTDLIHIDMAPRMTASEDDCLSKGSLGFGVYLLKEFAKFLEANQTFNVNIREYFS